MQQLIKTRIIIILFICWMLVIPQCGKKNGPAPTPAPTLQTITPISGFIGDSVSITGGNLADADGVYFNGSSTLVVQNTSSQITTVVPNGLSPGTDSVSVRTAGGTSNQLAFTIYKEPQFVDSLPPQIAQAIPTANPGGYPVLLYGNYLSGVVSLTFNGIEATINTNNHQVVTAIVPANLPVGSVTIKLITKKGTAIIPFQVSAGTSGAGNSTVNFSSVSIPPPDYVPSISNQWSCGLFQQTTTSGSTINFVDIGTLAADGVTFTTTGYLTYNYDKSKNYNDLNFITFTNSLTGVTEAGLFSSTSANPCILDMELISSIPGSPVTSCTFNLGAAFSNTGCTP
jgi:hypothetical protein